MVRSPTFFTRYCNTGTNSTAKKKSWFLLSNLFRSDLTIIVINSRHTAYYRYRESKLECDVLGMTQLQCCRYELVFYLAIPVLRRVLCVVDMSIVHYDRRMLVRGASSATLRVKTRVPAGDTQQVECKNVKCKM